MFYPQFKLINSLFFFILYAMVIDITELTSLLHHTQRSTVRQLLEGNLRSLQIRKQTLLSTKTGGGNVEGTSSSSSSSNSTTTTPVPVASSGSSSATAANSPDIIYTPVEKFGWEQNNEYVTVLCYDLQDVGKVKDSVQCSFTTDTFDLIIPGLQNKNYRLRVLNLDKDIIPEESKIKVKKNSIDILLRKKGKYDHWSDLVSKRTKETKKSSNSDDSGAGITDMLKQMYDDGDDNMKKVIAEAFVKSREEHKTKVDGGRKQRSTPGSSMGLKSSKTSDSETSYSNVMGSSVLDEEDD